MPVSIKNNGRLSESKSNMTPSTKTIRADRTPIRVFGQYIARIALFVASAGLFASSAIAQNGYTTPADVNGNGIYDFQEVTNVAISCTANTTVNSISGSCTAGVVIAVPTVTGYCGTFTLLNDFNNTGNASGTYPVGVTTV
ncbi:MAG: hypothetical protein ABI373_07765, partial [Flavobacteriales bacterium]